MAIIIRCDDFDPRITMTDLYPLHQEFVKRKIPMTIAVNTVMGWGYGFNPEVMKYVNETDPATWDIQLHGFEHERYWTYRESHFYRDMFANLMLTKRDFIHSDPKIFYPPWNETSSTIERICEELGLTVKTSKSTIRNFLKDWSIQGEDTFYWHWWTPDDRTDIPAVLDKVISLQNKNV